ncbi:S1 family peptidase [Photobacterium lutimaris]|uniref:GlyGly-CTERM sorting domain-containing protein n=1 Tax=Photobacterium lutimaris TaxID=388278 RepID=A0A2T3J488_9GAMM|nr:serine protease [Photobacterium lutimaris]PSU36109.1 GlyGly-CTERM sorting domain-containing protein [Photobacterium lutimaris]TDR79215.1 secreted trypsin-like serine protease [Photobacterium lutimaris]
MKLKYTPVAVALACLSVAPSFADESNIQTRVLNGEEASKLSSDLLLPWQAAFLTEPQLNDGTYITSGCGAVVISDFWAITAAHCIEPFMSNTLIAGTNIVKNQSGTADDIDDKFKFTITEKIVHRGYLSSPALDDDIALLKVDRSMLDVAKPIKVATQQEQEAANTQFANSWNPSGYSKANLIASGWGYTEPNFEQPNELMVVKLGGIPMTDCNADYPLSESSHFVCADSNNPAIKKDVCRGDSGGPLVWQVQEKVSDDDFGLRVIGVTSNGPYCHLKDRGDTDSQKNGLYTELAYYYNWIEAKTGLDLASQTTPSFSTDPFAKVSDPESKTGTSSGGSGGGSLPLSGLFGLAVLGILRRRLRD